MAQEKLLDIEIVTPQSILLNGKAQSVTLPGSLSPFQVLYNHAPIVSSLELGILKIVDESNNEIYYATSDGFAEIQNNKIAVLVETAHNATKLNADTINNEIETLKKKLAESSDKIAGLKLSKLIKQEENKLKALSKLKGN